MANCVMCKAKCEYAGQHRVKTDCISYISEPQINVLNDRIRSIKNEAGVISRNAGQWISVTERLPKGEAERYLVAVDFMAHGLRVSICYYAENLEEVDECDFEGEKRGGFYWYDGEYGYCEKTGVKYWMPLPEPPKGKNDDN